MNVGALIITTGLPAASGVAALLSEVGSITAGQRMIAAFQRAGIPMVGLVVGPEDKKAERIFSQPGVVFLRCEDLNADFFRGIQTGLSFMQRLCDRVLIVPGDTPLFLPQTVEALLNRQANLVVPETRHVNGYPVLLDQTAMALLLSSQDWESAKEAVRGKLQVESVCVEDTGILLRGKDMTYRKQLIQRHNSQLVRPVTDVMLCNGGVLYDARLSMLLHLVEQTRSVRDACSLMQISYSAAWNMLNHIEDELGYPLVKRIRGGSSGSGSILTEQGQALMHAYDGFTRQLSEEAGKLYHRFFDTL